MTTRRQFERQTRLPADVGDCRELVAPTVPGGVADPGRAVSRPEASTQLPIAPNDLLANTVDVLLQGLTGIAASERKELILSAGHILQRFRSLGFLGALRSEWSAMRERGRIRDDYAGTEQHLTCLQEILNALDTEAVDERRFDFMKRVFLVAATETASDRNSILPQQLMHLCRQFNSGEVVVLSSVFEIFSSGEYDVNKRDAASWLSTVADRSGLEFTALVETHEMALMSKYLISGRHYADRSGINPRDFRLTDLGIRLCRFVQDLDQAPPRV